MSASALSILVFGIYLVVIGTGFILMPNTILPLFKFPKTNEPWIRVMGAVVLVLGFYYIIAAQNELSSFFWATVVGRFGVLILFSSLVIFRKTKPMLILFGIIYAIGAVWTLLVS